MFLYNVRQLFVSVIQLVDINGKELGNPIQHNNAVLEVSLSHGGTALDRLLAFVDRTRDLYISTVHPKPTIPRKIEKLGSSFLLYMCLTYNIHSTSAC